MSIINSRPSRGTSKTEFTYTSCYNCCSSPNSQLSHWFALGSKHKEVGDFIISNSHADPSISVQMCSKLLTQPLKNPIYLRTNVFPEDKSHVTHRCFECLDNHPQKSKVVVEIQLKQFQMVSAEILYSTFNPVTLTHGDVQWKRKVIKTDVHNLRVIQMPHWLKFLKHDVLSSRMIRHVANLLVYQVMTILFWNTTD